MFSNSLKTIKIDRNMSKLWQIVSKGYDFYIIAFVGFIVWMLNTGYSVLLPTWPVLGNNKKKHKMYGKFNCNITFYKQIHFI
jgi:hypothetical protein